MKLLITKSDGTPTKSKVHALQFLEKKGISKDCLISENGQFYYESVSRGEGACVEQDPQLSMGDVGAQEQSSSTTGAKRTAVSVSWETPVFDKNNERTQLFIPGTDVIATIIGKHPAGQIKSVSSFEINIGQENFIMSVNLISKIFKVKEV